MIDKVLKVLLAIGVLISLIGLLMLPSALNTQTRDSALLGAGLAFFGLGALLVGMSLYLQARSLRTRIDADPNLQALVNAGKRKGTCDGCHAAAPLVQCTMHRMSLCGSCLVQHYEPRGCVYVPAVRKTSGKASRGAGAGRV